ncbi:amino acid adenylation domain-containing protein [Nonomuraea sp. LPB2021202275-12-8]|uniref:amino acid adenylation domain-containing protein n=1 Tax=Nonomuraea sp. LPB2021202275-12-8 TaxID=3120159 RepID=UPI00300C98AE
MRRMDAPVQLARLAQQGAARVAEMLDVSLNAIVSAAFLIVSAHEQRLEALGLRLTSPAGGADRDLRLPWRIPIGSVVRRVDALLNDCRLRDSPSVRMEIGQESFLLDSHGQWELLPSHPYLLSIASPPMIGAALPGSAERNTLLASRLAVLLSGMSEQLDQPAGRAALFSPADQLIIDAANDTAPVWEEGDVCTLIEMQIASNPSGTAIVESERRLSYGELAMAVHNLSDELAQAGIAAGDVAAVGMGRQIELIVTYLALWQLGAAFIPIDSRHPGSRLRAQLAAAGATAVVVPPGDHLRFDGFQTVVAEVRTTPSAARTPLRGVPSDLAYVMSTSGSTGTPKAVGIPHVALHNCIRAFSALLPIVEPRVACLTSPIFDISLLELLLPLASGGQLHLLDAETQRDPVRLVEWLRVARPDIVQATPTTWRMLLPYVTDELVGATVLCGGEALGSDLAKELVATKGRVWNVYGPTEATIWCTAGTVDAAGVESRPIGRPIAGVTAAVLDPEGRPVPVGQPGELYVAGVQLALGYLGDPEKTARAFPELAELGRMYRTGDLCSWHADGILRFHGRVDNQVKLRGHRIELEEIEAVAERHALVARAVAVVVDRTAGDQRLLVYVQPQPSAQPDNDDLRAHLDRSLPAALVPQHIVVSSALPQTANGKVDRKAVKAHGASLISTTTSMAAEQR